MSDIRDAIRTGTLPLIAVIGPTASGKTRLAVALAKAYNAEIISGDSRQVYKGMNLGTGKDLEEYGDVPYHLIDICPAGYKYNLHEYLRDFDIAEKQIRARKKNLILCGGTGMYVEAVLAGLKLPEVPENKPLRARLRGKSLEELTFILSSMKTLHNITDIDTCARAIRAIEIQTYYRENPGVSELSDRKTAEKRDAIIILIDIPREERRSRISQRLDTRLLQGMEEEIAELIKTGVAPEDLEYYGLEYKYVTQAVTGKISREEMRNKLEIAIHQFAKRQMTWYRGMERRGFKLNPVAWNLSESEFISQVSSIVCSNTGLQR